jgi:hypothetical protein
MSYYIHQTTGRLRVRTPVLKDEVDVARRSAERLACVVGVIAVKANACTGSITIHYDVAAVNAALLIRRLTDEGLLEGIIGFPTTFSGRRPKTVALSAMVEVAGGEGRIRISPRTRRVLVATAKLVLPIVAERFFGKPGRALVSALL